MEFREELEKHIDTLKKYKNNDFNEEQTKMALILPFIRILGYDAVSMNFGAGTPATGEGGWINKGYPLVQE